MTVSGRYNFATVDMTGASLDGNGNPIGSLNGDHTYHRFNPAVGLNFNPTKNLTLYTGYSEGMRAPTPVELSCANPAIPCSLPTGFTSDPDLQMIVSKTWEAGVRGQLAANIGWNAAIYSTTNQNDVQFIADGANNGVTGFFQNVGDTRRQGLELGVHGEFSGLSLAANASFVNATYQSSFTEAAPQNSSANPATGLITVNKGDFIPGIARKTLKLRADYVVSPAWDIGGNLIATSGQYAHGDENNQDSNGPLAGYTTLNLDSHYKLGANWTAFAKVTNLLNKDYNTFGILGQNMFTAQNELAVVPSAPRGIWIGVSYQFGGNKTTTVDRD